MQSSIQVNKKKKLKLKKLFWIIPVAVLIFLHLLFAVAALVNYLMLPVDINIKSGQKLDLAKPIKILQWNIGYIGNPWFNDEKELLNSLKNVDADFILLQEVKRTKPTGFNKKLDILADVATELKINNYAFSQQSGLKYLPFFTDAYGIAIFSKYQFEKVRNIKLSSRIIDQCLLNVTISLEHDYYDLNSQKIGFDIGTLHYDSSNMERRTSEIQNTVEFYKDNSNLFIFGGDTNIGNTGTEEQRIEQFNLLNSQFKNVDPFGMKGFSTMIKKYIKDSKTKLWIKDYKVDYSFVKPSVKYEWIRHYPLDREITSDYKVTNNYYNNPYTYGSDHSPIVTEFKYDLSDFKF